MLAIERMMIHYLVARIQLLLATSVLKNTSPGGSFHPRRCENWPWSCEWLGGRLFNNYLVFLGVQNKYRTTMAIHGKSVVL